MSFLTAEWNNLAIVNYEVNPNILVKYLPAGTELDLWQGRCYVSLIGFMFERVKVLGIAFPFHTDFEEVNLRFYVKRFENNEWRRGVVFIKEIVPRYAISIVANTLYKEHYQTLPMKHDYMFTESSKNFQYSWQKKKKWNSINFSTETKSLPIEYGSEEEFITEHYYGYTRYNDKTTIEYEVTHPRWMQYKVLNYKLDVDFKETYGEEFQFLASLNPVSVMVAVGSKITIESQRKI